jgi:hypothetical protein
MAAERGFLIVFRFSIVFHLVSRRRDMNFEKLHALFARWLGPFGEKSEAEISAHLIFPARLYLIARRVMKVI